MLLRSEAKQKVSDVQPNEILYGRTSRVGFQLVKYDFLHLGRTFSGISEEVKTAHAQL